MKNIAAAPHIAVTMYPVVVNLSVMLFRFVPVLSKNVLNILICSRKVTTVITMTSMESMTLSVTTVPKDLENDVPSYCFRMPHLDTSPIRGIIMLDAYEMNIASMQFAVLGFSPSGSSASFHLSPLNICAVTPNISENPIHHQSISCMQTSLSLPKSNPLYIQ